MTNAPYIHLQTLILHNIYSYSISFMTLFVINIAYLAGKFDIWHLKLASICHSLV